MLKGGADVEDRSPQAISWSEMAAFVMSINSVLQPTFQKN